MFGRVFKALVLVTPCLSASGIPSIGAWFHSAKEARSSALFFKARVRGGSAEFHGGFVKLHYGAKPITMTFPGSNSTSLPIGSRHNGVINTLIGKRPELWDIGADLFAEILYGELYPGIDLAYTHQGTDLKSEFRVRPGADPDRIRLQYQGADALSVAADGSLLILSGKNTIREQAPEVFQFLRGKRQVVDAAFRVLPGNQVKFTFGNYDTNAELIVDPILSSSTYLGGSGMDTASAVAVDADGYIYVAGWTDSPNLPVVNSPMARGGSTDAFVAKFSPDATTLVYCTYFGGNMDDRALGVAVDSAGSLYITGSTLSANFPVAGAIQNTLGGYRDAFLVKLNASGSVILFSTYFGGLDYDEAHAIAVDSFGNAYLAGETKSTNLPASRGYQSMLHGQSDAFVAKFSPIGSMIYCSYLGGALNDRALAIAVDQGGYAYLTGDTSSTDFPVVFPYQAQLAGNQNAFVSKVSPGGAAVVFSTYLGGSGGVPGYAQSGAAVVVDSAGCPYIAGITNSPNFPLARALQAGLRGFADVFVTKLSASGNSLIFSTLLGGSGYDSASAIGLDNLGRIYVAGFTNSVDFPMAEALQSANAGAYDGFVAELSQDGSTLIVSSYLGGSSSDAVNAISVNSGTIYVVGQTQSANYPVVAPAQQFLRGTQNAFLSKVHSLSVVGRVDTANCQYLAGWAWDTGNPRTTINIAIVVDGQTLTMIPAGWYRADLAAAGIGDGAHGFYLDLPSNLKDQRSHTIAVQVVETGQPLDSVNRTLTCSGLAGVDDTSNCTYLAGWGWDSSNPSAVVNVDLFDGPTRLATIPASLLRSDLMAAGIGNGIHGYYFPTPPSLHDGRPHTIRALFSGTSIPLGGTGRTFSCSAVGYDDTSNCTYYAGWVWDPYQPNQPLSVDLYDGSVFVLSVSAGSFRPDLLAAGIGNGYHGYYIPIPARFRDGSPHAVRLKISQSQSDLFGTGRVLTCP